MLPYSDKILKRKINIFLLGLCSNLLLAQDPQFSQFYSAPQFLNPAYTGLTDQHRFVANYRTQWPGVNKTYQTYMGAYDYNAEKANSGIGFYVLQDKAGTAGLKQTQMALNYAYKIKINLESQIRLGLDASYNLKSLDFTKLLFNDQLVTGSAVSLDAGSYQQRQYLDVGAGALYTAKKVWLGVVAKHLNQPNVSMVGQKDNLPVYFGVHGGYKYIVGSTGPNDDEDAKKYISAAFNYRHQLNYDQLDIGAYYTTSPITVGVWYRGIPFKKYSSLFPNSESVAVLLGFEIPKQKLRVGYSFDFTISTLKINNTKGAHEISLVYELASKQKRLARKGTVVHPKF